MRWYMGASTAKTWSELTAPEPSKSVFRVRPRGFVPGPPEVIPRPVDGRLLWQKQHNHILPIGFSRLAVMQADRYKKTDTL